MAARNLTLMTDLYQLTMMQGYFREQKNNTVIFDMFLGRGPRNTTCAMLRTFVGVFIIVPSDDKGK